MKMDLSQEIPQILFQKLLCYFVLHQKQAEIFWSTVLYQFFISINNLYLWKSVETKTIDR